MQARSWILPALLLIAGCAEPVTYRLDGSFARDLTPEEQEDWDQTLHEHGAESTLAFSDPPRYFIRGLDAATCTSLEAALKAKPYLREQSDCRRERSSSATPW